MTTWLFTHLFCNVAYYIELTGISLEEPDVVGLTHEIAINNIPSWSDLLHRAGKEKGIILFLDMFDSQGYNIAVEDLSDVISRYRLDAGSEARPYTFLKASTLNEEIGDSFLTPPHGVANGLFSLPITKTTKPKFIS